MELIQRYQIARNTSGDSGFIGSNPSWFAQKKVVAIITGLVIAIVVFVGGYFTGIHAFKHPDHDETEAVVQARSTTFQGSGSTSLKWEGNCPKKTAKCPQSYQGTPPLILISLDGFHPDYLKRGQTPTLNKIAQCGVHADFLYPVFPSKTFPNHYSIVTGLNPPSHGIIDNNMYEPTKRKLFKVGSPDMNEPYWYQKDPIWVTAVKQGKKTASFFWPGTEVKIGGASPTYFKKYSARLNFDMRVDQILEWLDLPPASRPSFLTLYINQPDHAAHASGTKSNQVNSALASADHMITRLFAGLQARNILDCVNVVILSDHGMTDTDCKNVVDVQKYMDVSQVFSTMGPFGRMRLKGRYNSTANDEIISKLKCQSPNMRVYPKEQLPVRMHYADNARIEPIFLDMDNGWTVVSKGVRTGDSICTNGAHGYDNLFEDMRAIFLAYGPSFKRNIKVQPFINTELYELFTELIDVTPNPNNGTRGSLHHILKSPKRLSSPSEPSPPALANIPREEEEYRARVNAARCSCQQTQKQTTPANTQDRNAQHSPFGIPYSAAENSTLRLMYNDDYILAYDLKLKIPAWTSFTLTGKDDAPKVEDICWSGDARVPMSDAAKCEDYSEPKAKRQDILQRPLYPPAFSESSSKEQAAYITNSVPKSMNHSKILENRMNQILNNWAKQNGQLNIVMGPAFDLQATGIRPSFGTILKTRERYGRLVVPSHIFVVATWCSQRVNKLSDCDTSKLVTQGFLLPNTPYPQNCEPAATVIQKNVARIVDIENLTGLSLFTGIPIYDAIRLRTMMPQRSVS